MEKSKLEPKDAALLRPIEKTTGKFWAFIGILLAIWAFGMYGWFNQLGRGLDVTGLSPDPSVTSFRTMWSDGSSG